MTLPHFRAFHGWWLHCLCFSVLLCRQISWICWWILIIYEVCRIVSIWISVNIWIDYVYSSILILEAQGLKVFYQCLCEPNQDTVRSLNQEIQNTKVRILWFILYTLEIWEKLRSTSANYIKWPKFILQLKLAPIEVSYGTKK